jgi:hypothetical protein
MATWNGFQVVSVSEKNKCGALPILSYCVLQRDIGKEFVANLILIKSETSFENWKQSQSLTCC